MRSRRAIDLFGRALRANVISPSGLPLDTHPHSILFQKYAGPAWAERVGPRLSPTAPEIYRRRGFPLLHWPACLLGLPPPRARLAAAPAFSRCRRPVSTASSSTCLGPPDFGFRPSGWALIWE